MNLDHFAFEPVPAVANPEPHPFKTIADPLGPLAALPGTWTGTGFNTIWRPHFPSGRQDRFLELNLTSETLVFEEIPGAIPNRGLAQKDIEMFGVHYMQQISDSALSAGIHLEPGIWATVPATTAPKEPPTVVRMASIPHGTAVLAQGKAFTIAGPPVIKDTDIIPFFGSDPSTQGLVRRRRAVVPRAEPGEEDEVPPAVRRDHPAGHHAGDGEEPQPRAAEGDRGPGHRAHHRAPCGRAQQPSRRASAPPTRSSSPRTPRPTT